MPPEGDPPPHVDPPPPPPPPPARQDPPPHRQADPPARQEPPAGGQDTPAQLRAEAAAWRVQYRQAQDDIRDAQARAQAAETALEAAKAKASEDAAGPLRVKLEKATKRAMTSLLEARMLSAGLQDKDLIPLTDNLPDAPKLEVDEDFNVKGVDELVAAFKKWKPEFFKAATPPATGGKNGTATPPPRSTSAGGEPPASGEPPKTDIRAMPKKDYERWKAEALKGLRAPGSAGFGV